MHISIMFVFWYLVRNSVVLAFSQGELGAATVRLSQFRCRILSDY